MVFALDQIVEDLLDWSIEICKRELGEEQFMALTAEAPNKPQGNKDSKDQPNKGSHMARVVGLTDLGHQPGWEFEGKPVPPNKKFRVTFELVRSKMADGRPHWVSRDYNKKWFEKDGISSGLANLVRAIDPENTTQDGKLLANLIDKPCMVTITLNKNGYAKVAGVSPMLEGFEPDQLSNPSFIFDMDDPDMAVYESLPEFVKDKIKQALDYPTSALAGKLKSMEL